MLDYCLSQPEVFLALLLIIALATTLLAQARTLPWQNVISAAALIALVSVLLQLVGLKTGMPFGHFLYLHNLGPRLFKLLPWFTPGLWIVAILNSRGVARLILRPWRELPNRGIRSIALTCLLTLLFDAALEPFAVRANHFWFWRMPKTSLSWYRAPAVNFLGWAFATLIILVIATPWLLNKKPGANAPPDYYPLLIWLILTTLLAVANASYQMAGAALFTFSANILIILFAWRGSQQKDHAVRD